MRVPDFFARTRQILVSYTERIRGDKRIYIALVAFLVVSLAVWGYLGYREYALRWSVPEVLGTNFSLEYRKIPFDVKSLDITFSTDMDGTSIAQKSVMLAPFVEGAVSLKNQNTISYALGKKLTVGEKYTLTIASTVRSKYGVELGKDMIFTFEAIAGAKATKILPSGHLENLGQNIVVLFNIPIVALTTLANRDTLPCPLTIKPAVEGTCKWTNGNVLEFVPSKPLESATKYHLKVADTPGLLYSLAGSLEDDIVTPELAVHVFTGGFLPKSGISIVANAPVDPSELQKSLDLSEGNMKLEEQVTPEKDASGTLSETRFFLTTKDHPFTYSTDYLLAIKKGLKPKYGTEPLASDGTYNLRSANFLSNILPYRNVTDASGAIVAIKEFNDTPYIPVDDLIFRVTFAEEVALDPNLFSLQSKDGKKIETNLKYAQEEEYSATWVDMNRTKDNKYVIDVTPKISLGNNLGYTFAVLKQANVAMPKDEIKNYSTVPKMAISDLKSLSNTESCVYSATELSSPNGTYSDQFTAIKTVPASKIHDLAKDETMDWSTNTKTHRCPQQVGKISYIVGTRLAPNTAYSLVFTAATEDFYGQKLGKDVSFGLKTGPIVEGDKYLYSSLNRDVQVIPGNLPITLNLQSINIDHANLEVCEMDGEGYRHFLSNRGNANYNPICTNDFMTGVTLKNHYWTLTPNKFDLERDVLGRAFTSPYVFVRGSVNRFHMGSDGFPDNEREFSHLFVRSNLSLTLEDANNKKLLFASSYDGKVLPNDLVFETYSRSDGGTYQPLNMAITFNKSTLVYEMVDPSNKLSLVIAKNASYFGVLNTTEDQVSNYDFKYISGQDSSAKDYLYVYSDRPLYKAGDMIYYKGLLRTFNFDGYHASGVKTGKLKLVGESANYGEEWAVLKEADVKIDQRANFNGKFELPKDMPLGRYHFEFFAGADKTPIYNNGEFYVEAYKKPVFKVVTTIASQDATLGGSVDLKADAEYYFGGRFVNTDYTYSVLSQNYYFNAKNYADYQFGLWYKYMDCLYWGSCEYGDQLVTTATGRLDSKWETSIHYDYPKEDSKERDIGEKIYTYTVEVTDPDTAKTVSNQASQILHATDAYVGIRVPYWNTKKNGAKVDGVVLDFAAKGISGKDVKIELIKREWKSVKKEGVDGTFYNESSVEEKLETTKALSSDSRGEFSEVFRTAWDGEYEVRATYTGSNKQSFVSSSIIFVSGEQNAYWNEGNNSVTDLIADKSILSIGDTAGFTLKSPVASGKMLVTIEKDDGILDYFVRDITSTSPRIEFPIKESYVPNVYVKVFLIGQDPGAKLPTYKRALAVVKVLTDPKKLSIAVTTDKTRYLPGDPVKITVSVKDASGKPTKGANGSLSVVDESLLALAGNPKKNPFAFFYDMKRYLGIETYVSLLNLIEKLEVKDTSSGEKWGAWDGTKGGSSSKKRGIFKDMAYWQADFTTDANGNYSVTTDRLPDNLTTWNIESVVNTADNRVGVADTSIMTSKTVIVNDNLPRFLGVGDVITMAPVVFNKTLKNATFDVTAEATNATIKDPKRSVAIKSGEQAVVPFEMTVIDSAKLRSLGTQGSKITIKAVSRATNELDEVENILPIVDTATTETVATVGKTDTSADEKISIPEAVRANGGSLTVSYAATLLPNLLSGMKYLENFPYGCIEQRLASVMPTVYLKELYDSAKLPFDLKTKMVKEYIDKEEGYREKSIDDIIRNTILSAPNFQKPDGGFSYWTESEKSDFRLTIGTVSRLAEIRSIGYAVNDAMLGKAVSYLKKQFYANKRENCQISRITDETCEYGLTERLAVVESLLDASSQDYEAYKMYKLLSFGKDATSAKINRVRVIAKLLRINEIVKTDKDALQKDVKDLIQSVTNEDLVYNPRGAFLGNDLVYSRLDNTTRFLEALTLALSAGERGEYAQITDQMERWIISEKKSDGSFGSTADTSGVIGSLAHAMRASGELGGINLHAKISLDTVSLEERSIDQGNKLATFSKTVGLDQIKDNSSLHIEKSGLGNLYYDLALTYSVPSKHIATRDEGFFLEQSWYDYDEYRRIEQLKNEEWVTYLSGSIAFKDLKYPKEIVEYLTPLTTPTVGKLVFVHNRAIFGEPRDQVSFEGFIPSGAELVNPMLKTESQSSKFNTIFDHEEFRDDRYFGTVSSLDAGVYSFGYVMRPTHAGIFQMLPSKIFEFYHPEVFGRTGGKEVKIGE